LDVGGDVGEEVFSVFVEVDDNVGFQKIFVGRLQKIVPEGFRRCRTPRSFGTSPLQKGGVIPVVGEVAGVHEEVCVGIPQLFYFLYGLEVAEVEVGGVTEEEVEEFFSSFICWNLDSSHDVEKSPLPPFTKGGS
jgi:hypothetical protein